MTIEAALREWETQCWEAYNHEDDYDELLEYSKEKKKNDKTNN